MSKSNFPKFKTTPPLEKEHHELEILREYSKNLEIALYLIAKESLSWQSTFPLMNDKIPLKSKNDSLRRTLSAAMCLNNIDKGFIGEIKKIREYDFDKDIFN